jgi:hypothetical protein
VDYVIVLDLADIEATKRYLIHGFQRSISRLGRTRLATHPALDGERIIFFLCFFSVGLSDQERQSRSTMTGAIWCCRYRTSCS